VESEAAALIQRSADSLRRTKLDVNRIFTGNIVELHHEPDDAFGEIAVATMLNGRASEIRVRLRKSVYDQAAIWHLENRPVVVEGNIRRATGRPLRLDEPSRIHPLDESYLPFGEA